MADLENPNPSENSYDTQEVLLGLQKQRRRQHLVAVFGLLLLVGLLSLAGWYLNARPQTAHKPVVVAPLAPTKPPAAVAVPAMPTPASAPSLPAPNKPLEAVHVRVKLNKTASLWIDNQWVGGAKKNYDLKLAVGEHRVKARFGRRVVEETFAVVAARPLLISIHARRKHMRVTHLK